MSRLNAERRRMPNEEASVTRAMLHHLERTQINKATMKKHKVPCKKFYRQRAHCNPLSDSYIRYPVNCSYVDWRVHYPHLLSQGRDAQAETINSVETKHTTNVGAEGPTGEGFTNEGLTNEGLTNEGFADEDPPTLQLNTNKYPIDYNQGPPKYATQADVTILDIGCGYGGLLFELSKIFTDKLILGMEIRDKITNYVGEKINSYRKNYPPHYQNISVIRTNAMKFLPNYIKKNQMKNFFFVFLIHILKNKIGGEGLSLLKISLCTITY
ncbi:tRNA (guanine-N(7)-)-methyltransferase [Plasmodium cynomolgi strain B]|uniref:tRNA (guanine(46)-N(7))-methyltransferase n=1 Tax=Plasmodium cynomolgi (strain B) TaxID=1120755 RepID=K6UTF0_PLACD|nr:tRNA (guanine-N(7)-)-methyltransferase [Plasmodium cynomolgi strain B]GAB66549.1 tRNA (guanine-N(7)-)-methyltransferase [Plasmodium cynomolgi strain B]